MSDPATMRRLGICLCHLAAASALLLSGCPERGSAERGEPGSAGPSAPGVAKEPETPRKASKLQLGEPGLAAREPGAEADESAVVTVALPAEPAHLNPLLGADALTAQIALGDVYEGLLCNGRVDAPARPCLAESVAVSPDGTEWSFTLRSGVAWHDGAAFSAADVGFTYQLFTGVAAGQVAREKPALSTWLAGEFDDLERIAIRTDGPAGAIVVTMTFAGFRLGRREAFARVPILPRHRFAGRDAASLASADENRSPVGTGPLRVTGWTAGREIVLQRFAGYWGAPARAAGIRYRVITSRQRVARALVAGTVDIATRVPADEAVATAREHADVRVFAETSPSYLAAVYNLRRPPLDDVHMRRALGLLMDRPTLADALFAGYAQPIAGPHLPGDPDRDPELAPLPYEPERGRAELLRTQFAQGRSAAAGRADRSAVELAVLVPSESRTMRRLADIWAADVRAETETLTRGRVALTIDIAPYARVLSRLRAGDFDIALMAFTTGLDLDLHSRFHADAPENYGGLADQVLDRALAAVRGQPDIGARRVLQRAVQARIHELQPYTFITSGSQVGLVRSGIGGFASASAGARGLWRGR